MPSPLAHSLAGLSVSFVMLPTGGTTRADRLRWTALLVFAANAADLDFFAGAVTGSVNALHGGPTHSLAAGVLAAGLGLLLPAHGRPERLRAAFAVFAAYVSHIALDVLCELPGHPNRLALLWPFTDDRWTAPLHVFSGILHGPPGTDLAGFFEGVFTLHNLFALLIEALVLGPVALLAWRLRAKPGAALALKVDSTSESA